VLSTSIDPSATPSLCDAVAGNLVANCGFENGSYSSTIDGATNTDVPVDWTPNYGFNLEPGFNHVNSGNQHSGSYDLSIGNFDSQPLATLSQTISDVNGTSYSGSFWAYDGGANGDGNAYLQLSINGTALVTLDDTVANWTEYTFSFTGTGSDQLTIGAQTNPSEWYVDDVVVTGALPTPEPASLLLLGSGILSMTAVLRRKRA
jgi:PEP-CTERM motif